MYPEVPALKLVADLYLGRFRRCGDLQNADHQIVRRDILEGEGSIFAGEVREAGDNGFCLSGGLVNFQHIIIGFFGVRRQFFQNQNGVTHNGCQKVVEFMGNAGGQGADDLQPLMVGQSLRLLSDRLQGKILFPKHEYFLLGSCVAPGYQQDGASQQQDSDHNHAAIGGKPYGGHMDGPFDGFIIEGGTHCKHTIVSVGWDGCHARRIGFSIFAGLSLVEKRHILALALAVQQRIQFVLIDCAACITLDQGRHSAFICLIQQGSPTCVQKQNAVLGAGNQISRHSLIKFRKLDQYGVLQLSFHAFLERKIDGAGGIHAGPDVNVSLQAGIGRKHIVCFSAGGV